MHLDKLKIQDGHQIQNGCHFPYSIRYVSKCGFTITKKKWQFFVQEEDLKVIQNEMPEPTTTGTLGWPNLVRGLLYFGQSTIIIVCLLCSLVNKLKLKTETQGRSHPLTPVWAR